jgi:hypothetical protein
MSDNTETSIEKSIETKVSRTPKEKATYIPVMTGLAEQIKQLSFVTVQGIQYIGKVEKTEAGCRLSEASTVVVKSFPETIKTWIKYKNLSNLEEYLTEGLQVSYSKKEFNEEQKMKIDIIAAEAEYAIKYAIPNLQNSAI